jgi:hypothetical protein
LLALKTPHEDFSYQGRLWQCIPYDICVAWLPLHCPASQCMHSLTLDQVAQQHLLVVLSDPVCGPTFETQMIFIPTVPTL